jgi:hypothetical protein
MFHIYTHTHTHTHTHIYIHTYIHTDRPKERQGESVQTCLSRRMRGIQQETPFIPHVTGFDSLLLGLQAKWFRHLCIKVSCYGSYITRHDAQGLVISSTAELHISGSSLSGSPIIRIGLALRIYLSRFLQH